MKKSKNGSINWNYLSNFVQIPESKNKVLVIHRFYALKVVPKAESKFRSRSRAYFLLSTFKSAELAIICLYRFQNRWLVTCTWRSKFMDEELFRYLTAEIISKLNYLASHAYNPLKDSLTDYKFEY